MKFQKSIWWFKGSETEKLLCLRYSIQYIYTAYDVPGDLVLHHAVWMGNILNFLVRPRMQDVVANSQAMQ